MGDRGDEKELAALSRRVARLEDQREILRLLSAYGSAVDYGDAERFVGCFTADGVLELSRPKSEQVAVRADGREELAAFARSHSRAPQQWHKHLVLETDLEIDGDEAGATSYYVLLQDHERVPVVRSFGRYVDRLVRTDDGWAIAHRRAEVEAALAGLSELVGNPEGGSSREAISS
jgi:SnoaL-like domain